MKRSVSTMLCCSALLAFGANAEESAQVVGTPRTAKLEMDDGALLIGAGNLTCRQFDDEFIKHEPARMYGINQWVWGFMSAYSVRNNFGDKRRADGLGNLLTAPDGDTALVFLSNFCSLNPSAHVLDGTVELTRRFGGHIVWGERRPAPGWEGF
ncbi:hypothetical protein OKW41_006157 [Paraburkholderia sp. UCT70]|uniref:hypothetical protein n=1 Tax=Paraburkholderia sp. UCT70 TaxID=2991068 RepID=UPI003D1F86E6